MPSLFLKAAAKPALTRTNAEVVQEVAKRAESWGARQGLPASGEGAVQGTLKHAYADKLLTRYQSIYGDLGLQTEVSYVSGNAVRYGFPGSVRFDVLDIAGGVAYDYKFVLDPFMSAARTNQLLMNGPSGLNRIILITP